MRSFLTVIASAVVLAGCAGQTTKGYVRTGGVQSTWRRSRQRLRNARVKGREGAIRAITGTKNAVSPSPAWLVTATLFKRSKN